MQMKRRKSKSLFVVKSMNQELKDLDVHKQSETKNLYVVRTDDEVANKYGPIVYDFVDSPGVFLLITQDRNFYRTFRSAIIHDLDIEPEYVHAVHDLSRAAELVQFFHEKKVMPCIFMEHSMGGEMTLSFLRFIRASFKEVKIAILSRELDKDRLFQFFEDGADSFLKKPACVNSVLTKIAFMIRPQSEVDAMVQEGREHVEANRFEEAIEVANIILSKWPKNAAAMVIYGDAKKGQAQRQEALSAYVKAERNSKDYLEPLQKIVRIHTEDDNKDECLRYLVKLDRISPLNCNRKLKIAELHFDRGDSRAAEDYFDSAIDSAKMEALSVVGEMAIDIAEMAACHDPKMAAKYYRKSLDFVKSSKSGLAMNIYNRLGISLRKQGLWEQAVEAYNEAIHFSPKDENLQYNIALAYAEGENFSESAKHMSKALLLNPELYHDKADLAFKVCEVLTKGRQKPEAVSCLKHLSTISPEYPGLKDLIKEVKT